MGNQHLLLLHSTIQNVHFSIKNYETYKETEKCDPSTGGKNHKVEIALKDTDGALSRQGLHYNFYSNQVTIIFLALHKGYKLASAWPLLLRCLHFSEYVTQTQIITIQHENGSSKAVAWKQTANFT